jgi:NAD(P)-dependent dehydrogenase (short-subunit alcohol dehydrogenase family)
MKTSVLITGSTSGIGQATALALAQQGWQVIVHGRREEACEEVVAMLIRQTNNSDIHYAVADLSDLAQVKRLADDAAIRFPSLKVLIHNAGTFSHSRMITEAGFERTWVVNYLARFALTKHLLHVLRRNSPARIIDVSGAYHAKGAIHFDDLSLAREYTLYRANNQAKLANVLWTYAQARALAGTAVTVNTLHPGAVNTGSILKSDGFSGFSKWMYRLLSPFLLTPAQGAEALVYLATAPELDGLSGKYFVKRKVSKSSKASYDVALQDRLWAISEQVLAAAAKQAASDEET